MIPHLKQSVKDTVLLVTFSAVAIVAVYLTFAKDIPMLFIAFGSMCLATYYGLFKESKEEDSIC